MRFTDLGYEWLTSDTIQQPPTQLANLGCYSATSDAIGQSRTQLGDLGLHSPILDADATRQSRRRDNLEVIQEPMFESPLGKKALCVKPRLHEAFNPDWKRV